MTAAASGALAAGQEAAQTRRRRLLRRLGPFAPVLVLVALCILVSLVNPNFLSARNLVRIANTAAIPFGTRLPGSY